MATVYAVRVDKGSGDIPLTTALVEVEFVGPSLDVAYFNSDVDFYLTVGDRFEAGLDPAPSTERVRIPAGIMQPYRITRTRTFVSSVAGIGTAWAFAVADVPTDWSAKRASTRLCT